MIKDCSVKSMNFVEFVVYIKFHSNKPKDPVEMFNLIRKSVCRLYEFYSNYRTETVSLYIITFRVHIPKLHAH